jgi:hypothetical protein
VHHAAGQIHDRVDKRVSRATVLGLHVVDGISDANIRVEAEIHGFSDLPFAPLPFFKMPEM